MTGKTGTLQSANYPFHYPHNTRCEWIITAPQGMKVKLSFDAMNIESCSTCSCDALELYDGQNSHATLLARYCGSNNVNGEMLSSDRYMFVKFKSDVKSSSTGFRGTYEFVSENVGK
jgi:hypothetical protein